MAVSVQVPKITGETLVRIETQSKKHQDIK